MACSGCFQRPAALGHGARGGQPGSAAWLEDFQEEAERRLRPRSPGRRALKLGPSRECGKRGRGQPEGKHGPVSPSLRGAWVLTAEPQSAQGLPLPTPHHLWGSPHAQGQCRAQVGTETPRAGSEEGEKLRQERRLGSSGSVGTSGQWPSWDTEPGEAVGSCFPSLWSLPSGESTPHPQGTQLGPVAASGEAVPRAPQSAGCPRPRSLGHCEGREKTGQAAETSGPLPDPWASHPQSTANCSVRRHRRGPGL